MRLPVLRPEQHQILMHPAKVKVVCCPRRWGKTVTGGVAVGSILAQHGQVAWVTPTYKNSRPVWRWMLNACADDIKAKRMSVNKSENTIETKGGGLFALFSGENIDAMRAWSFHLVVGDEAARLPEDGWTDVIMPTLADHDGDALLISTPKGRNWFWREYQRMYYDETYMSWSRPITDNPNPNIRRAAELAKTRMPELKYKQEWLAEFVDEGTVFRRVRESATAKHQGYAMDGHPSHPKHSYVVGVDWGKYEDYSVFAVIDTTIRELCYLDRSNRIDYTLQVRRLEDICKRYQVSQVIAESNANATTIELLRKANLPVREFVTTNQSKQNIIEGLMLGLESSKLKILNEPVLLGELQAFEATRLPGGGLRYAAPSGYHDDCVMALALAWDAAKDSNPVRVEKRSR
jgi:hypothetical protein